MRPTPQRPFALSLSKRPRRQQGYDRLSPNGGAR
jgi:hypothetical protein